jgi:hypothetical protein
MTETDLRALDPFDTLGYLAALGTLNVVSRVDPGARLRWVEAGRWYAQLVTGSPIDAVAVLHADVERWRGGHPAVDFAVGAERKVQDLKHPPDEYRALMRRLAADPEAAGYAAAYATGVAVDGSGQTKPTSFHLTAGQQRFMDAILSLREGVTTDDLAEALFGPWVGREGPKDPRWRAASERSRALLSFDPGTTRARTIAGAAWLAFRALPLFPVVPRGLRALTTTGFAGRGRNERFIWSVWTPPISVDEARVVVGLSDPAGLSQRERAARGIALVLRCDVARSDQGYGNFSAAVPV